MVGIALTSIAVGIFDVKYYVNLQVVPHISKYHQYWRLFTYHLACGNSSDLFLTELLLYNVGVQIERSFGSAKYASFVFVTMLVSTIFTFLSLLTLQLFHGIGPLFNNIHPGPISVMFSILYQYMRLIPQAYQFKVFGAVVSDKIWVYVVAGQLAISYVPASLLPALIGIFTGYVYRSDVLQLKGWRIPHRFVTHSDNVSSRFHISIRVQNFSEDWIQPLLGEGRTVRRTNRVLPVPRVRRRPAEAGLNEDEVVTTARPTDVQPRTNTEEAQATRRRRQADIDTLSTMFPDVRRAVINDVVERSPNVESAAAILLSSRT